MTQTEEPYKISAEKVGYLEQEHVLAVHMPRSHFITLVNAAIEIETQLSGEYPEVAEGLREVAKTMPHFPMNTWIDPDRGCGCVVGEYLIASDIIEREDQRDIDVMSELRRLEDGPFLIGVGQDIDTMVQQLICAKSDKYEHDWSGLVTAWAREVGFHRPVHVVVMFDED